MDPTLATMPMPFVVVQPIPIGLATQQCLNSYGQPNFLIRANEGSEEVKEKTTKKRRRSKKPVTPPPPEDSDDDMEIPYKIVGETWQGNFLKYEILWLGGYKTWEFASQYENWNIVERWEAEKLKKGRRQAKQMQNHLYIPTVVQPLQLHPATHPIQNVSLIQPEYIQQLPPDYTQPPPPSQEPQDSEQRPPPPVQLVQPNEQQVISIADATRQKEQQLKAIAFTTQAAQLASSEV